MPNPFVGQRVPLVPLARTSDAAAAQVYIWPTGPDSKAAMRLSLSTLLLIAACSPGSEQPADSQAASQAAAANARLTATEGGQIVLRAITAHGGLEAWYAAPTSSYNWEYSNVGSNTRFKSYLVVDNASRLAYHDLTEMGVPDSVAAVDAQFAWNGEVAWMNPPEMMSPNPMFWATTGFYFESIPFVLADPGLRYNTMPVDTLDGHPYDMVRVSYDVGVGYSDGDSYLLYVDQETDMIRAIRYTVTFGRGRPAEGAPQRENLFYYNDYTTVDGLTVPTHFVGYQYANGQKGNYRNEAWASDISFRRPFDPARLDVPEGARLVSPPSTES
jgi:hypothetical protein